MFLDVLRCWAATTKAAEIAAGLEAIPAELAAMTRGMQPSSRSQNHFDDLMLDHVRTAATADGPAPTSYTIDSVSPARLALTPLPASLRFAIIGDEHHRSAPIEIPADRLPAVIVGMIWRSYGDGAMTLTRLNTDTYEAALAAFQEGVDAARADRSSRATARSSCRSPQRADVQRPRRLLSDSCCTPLVRDVDCARARRRAPDRCAPAPASRRDLWRGAHLLRSSCGGADLRSHPGMNHAGSRRHAANGCDRSGGSMPL